jgi:hypothetical protein
MFSINETALLEIERKIREIAVSDPVASLSDVAKSQNLFNEVEKAVRAGTSRNRIEELARKRFNEIESELEYCLDVSIYERDQCRSEDLRSINGVIFAMPDYISDPLNGYVLHFDGHIFVLRKGNDEAVNLQSILAKPPNARSKN